MSTKKGKSEIEAVSTMQSEMIWANLIHLSYNMWEEAPPEGLESNVFEGSTCAEARAWAHGYRDRLTFDEPTWNALLKEMSDSGMNMVVLDLGDAIQYKSHPELAVEDAWSPKKLKAELAKMRAMNIEPIPKLNFATSHDVWLGKYARMVSTDIYYGVCKDLIEEVCAIFDQPRFFHLGMDEETAAHQVGLNYAVMRQKDLWWHDLYLLADEASKHGSRPWIWSDYAWNNEEEFFKKMPKEILQSNWYYGNGFDVNGAHKQWRKMIEIYDKLEKHGYDQIPTGSTHSNDENFGATVEYAEKTIHPSRLFGFLMTVWRPTLSACQERHSKAISITASARKAFQLSDRDL